MKTIWKIKHYVIFGLLLITLSGCSTDSSETTSVPAERKLGKESVAVVLEAVRAGNKLETKQGRTASQSPQDLFKLGKRYVKGEDVPQDKNKGIQLIRDAAEQGYAEAQCFIGACYSVGNGVKEDKAEGVKWFHKAAKQGYAKAQSALGACYGTGNGVEKDKAEAVKWYRKAAEQGNAEGQFGLGLCYFEGEGVKKDKAEAVKWFRKAAEQGFAQAKEVLQQMN
jgi:TPR repeat protein